MRVTARPSNSTAVIDSFSAAFFGYALSAVGDSPDAQGPLSIVFRTFCPCAGCGRASEIGSTSGAEGWARCGSRRGIWSAS